MGKAENEARRAKIANDAILFTVRMAQSGDLQAARTLEEIIGRGDWKRYVIELDRIIDIEYEGSGYHVGHVFQFIRATPQQRAQAFLAVVEQANHADDEQV